MRYLAIMILIFNLSHPYPLSPVRFKRLEIRTLNSVFSDTEIESYFDIIRHHAELVLATVDSCTLAVYFQETLSTHNALRMVYTSKVMTAPQEELQQSFLGCNFPVITHFPIQNELLEIGVMEVSILNGQNLTAKDTTLISLIVNSLGAAIAAIHYGHTNSQTASRDEMVLDSLSSIQTLSKMLRRRLPKQDDLALETVDNILVQTKFAWDLIANSVATDSLITTTDSDSLISSLESPVLTNDSGTKINDNSNHSLSLVKGPRQSNTPSLRIINDNLDIFYNNSKYESIIQFPKVDNENIECP